MLLISEIAKVAAVSPDSIFFAVIFAVVSSLLPYIFYTYGLKYVESGKASIMATIETVVASLAGIIAFGEKLSLTGFSGMVLVLSAVVLLNLKSSS